MSKYKEGDRFIIEIDGVTPIYNKDGKEVILHKVKGFNSLVFDVNGLDKLQKYGDEQIPYSEAYEKGLNDAWELAGKIATKKISFAEARDCFGIDINFKSGADITREIFSIPYQEALAKIEAYEKEQSEICVGDVVRDEYGKNLCVTRVSEDKSVVECFGPGGMMHRYSYNCVTKTDKHLDIMSLLNQIGE